MNNVSNINEVAVNPQPPKKTRFLKKTTRETLLGWGIVGPIILYFAIFGLIPIGMLIKNTLYSQENIFSPNVFVGLGNYKKIFTDPLYYELFFATLLIAVFTIGISIVLGMFIAVLITGPIKLKGFYRTIYYIPVVLSTAIVSQIVSVWLDYNDGTFNNIVELFGGTSIAWKDSTFWMYFWIILICVWKGLGATIILLVAGLSAISPEILEAAELDGAGAISKFFKVTLPQLRPMLVFVMITSIIGAFNVFEPVQMISNGGPDGTTKVILYQIYDEAFKNGNYGMACAISTVLLIILMALTVLNMKAGEEKNDEPKSKKVKKKKLVEA